MKRNNKIKWKPKAHDQKVLEREQIEKQERDRSAARRERSEFVRWYETTWKPGVKKCKTPGLLLEHIKSAIDRLTGHTWHELNKSWHNATLVLFWEKRRAIEGMIEADVKKPVDGE